MTEVQNLNVADSIPESHELRKMKWQNKQFAKQLGHQGETIHHLRCELAEVRELNGRVERGELRDFERAVARMDEIIRGMAVENANLLKHNKELYDTNQDLRTQLNAKLVTVINNSAVGDGPVANRETFSDGSVISDGIAG